MLLVHETMTTRRHRYFVLLFLTQPVRNQFNKDRVNHPSFSLMGPKQVQGKVKKASQKEESKRDKREVPIKRALDALHPEQAAHAEQALASASSR